MRWLAVTLLALLALAPAAAARKPVIAYVDEEATSSTFNKLRFFDSETGNHVAGPDPLMPVIGGRRRFSVSHDGRYVAWVGGDVEILKVDPESEREQVERLKAFKEDRDQEQVHSRLEELREVAKGEGNLLQPIRAALKDRATIGEVCGVMREEFGEYQEA